MSRKRRSARAARRPDAQQEALPRWRWRTAPVLMALSGGFMLCWIISVIETGSSPGAIATVLYYVAIMTFAFAGSRISSQLMRQWMLRRARRKESREGAAGQTGSSSSKMR